MKTVRDLGEFGLIDRLVRSLPAPGDPDLIVGIGDDAAVWRTGAGYTIATTDTMVASVHFLPAIARWQDVGWKALATNISDIAAMGGTPRFALVTLCLPPETPTDEVDALYAGLAECAESYGVTIVGGDIVSSPTFTLTIALTGEAAIAADGSPLLLRRNTARIGDLIVVTGALGASAAGLRAMRDDAPLTEATRRLIARHMRPTPRVDAAHAALAAGIRCAIDVSDGLAQDLGRICEASGVAATINAPAIPIDPVVAAAYPGDALAFAASGGEDYELSLIGAKDAIARIDTDVATTVIGEIVADGRSDTSRVTLLGADGRAIELPSAGWDHLAADGAR